MVWFILFLIAAGFLAVALLMVLILAVAMHRQKNEDDANGRELYVSYPEPDFSDSAGFRIAQLPQSEILIPQNFWLINNCIAEVEYNVVPAERVWLRLAKTGCLQCPDAYEEIRYQHVADYEVDGVSVNQRQSAGGWNLLRWSRDGYDFALYAPFAQMNLMGGIIQTVVSEMEILQNR